MSAKRYATGHVKNHRDFKTTFQDCFDWIGKFLPVTLVMEQVEGFDKPEVANGDTTPFQRRTGSGCGYGGYGQVEVVAQA